MSKAKPTPTYNEADIEVHEGLAHVRFRPKMYFGGVDIHALSHMVYEVLDNSLEEAMLGLCDEINITLYADASISIQDNGSGIRVERDKIGRCFLELIMTTLGTGVWRDNNRYHISGGLHGVGLAAVNALSETLTVEVKRKGKLHRQSYKAGRPVTPVETIRNLEKDEATGTKITFRPDSTILQATVFDHQTLLLRFKELAFLVPGLKITIRDERIAPVQEAVFHSQNGLVDFIQHLNRNEKPIHEIIHTSNFDTHAEENNNPYIGIHFAFQFTHSETRTILSYVNTVETIEEGVHVEAFLLRFIHTLEIYAEENAGMDRHADDRFRETDILNGLTAIIHVKHPSPEFENAIGMRLFNPDIKTDVSIATSDFLETFAETHPDQMQAILDNALANKRTRELRRYEVTLD